MSLVSLLSLLEQRPPLWSLSSSPTQGTEQQHLSYNSHQTFLPPWQLLWEEPELSREQGLLTFCEVVQVSSLGPAPTHQCHGLVLSAAAQGLLRPLALLVIFRVHQH